MPLLAHAREVDINDTELMMGDDDGFLSVVIANRLPLAGVGPDGADQPVKYLACLVNLEGQFDVLLPESPPHVIVTTLPVYTTANVLTTAQYDQVKMGASPAPTGLSIGAGTVAPLAIGDGQALTHNTVATTGTPPYTTANNWSLEQAERSASNVYAEMAVDFGYSIVSSPPSPSIPRSGFPVLLHWSFISSGTSTFESADARTRLRPDRHRG